MGRILAAEVASGVGSAAEMAAPSGLGLVAHVAAGAPVAFHAQVSDIVQVTEPASVPLLLQVAHKFHRQVFLLREFWRHQSTKPLGVPKLGQKIAEGCQIGPELLAKSLRADLYQLQVVPVELLRAFGQQHCQLARSLPSNLLHTMRLIHCLTGSAYEGTEMSELKGPCIHLHNPF